MRGRAIPFFIVLILCIAACRVLFLFPPDHTKGQLSNSIEILLKDAGQRFHCRQLTISPAKANWNPDLTAPISLCEKEETEDDDETSDAHDHPLNLHGRHNEAVLVNSLEQSRKISTVPLFVLLHSWKHFLS
jgi:hypothetical protein